MSTQAPWDSVPDNLVVDEGIYQLVISSLEEKVSAAGNLMFALESVIEDPLTFGALTMRDWFVIGNEEDPLAEDPETWRKARGAQKLKRFLKGAQVQLDADMDIVCANAVDSRFLAKIVIDIDDGKKNPEYKGQQRNRMTSYFAIGTRDIGVSGNAAESPPATKPTPGKVKAKAKAKPPAAVIEKAKPKVKAKAKAGEIYKCVICNEEVPKADFRVHVADHDDEE